MPFHERDGYKYQRFETKPTVGKETKKHTMGESAFISHHIETKANA